MRRDGEHVCLFCGKHDEENTETWRKNGWRFDFYLCSEAVRNCKEQFFPVRGRSQ